MNNLENICHIIRLGIIERSYLAGKNSAHVGGSLSAVEILAILFHGILQRPEDLEQRDRFFYRRKMLILLNKMVVIIQHMPKKILRKVSNSQEVA